MSGRASYADWVAVDWGTSRLRVWAMGADGSVRAEAASDDGMGGLARDGFAPALLDLIGPWLGAAPMPVLACGMVGSRQGWAEMPYIAVPAKPGDLMPQHVKVGDARLRLFILPGLSQTNPADVMRGEETQVAGFLAQEPGFDGVLCLPGTHTKWVQISAAEIVSFQTYMTGEMFALLAGQSVLRHSIAPGGDAPDAFVAAVADSISRPERLAQRLFALRAENVLHGLDGVAARARLSGHLIGAELSAARPYWLGQNVVVAGAAPLAGLYGQALAAQGVPVRVVDADGLTLAGLIRAAVHVLEPAS